MVPFICPYPPYSGLCQGHYLHALVVTSCWGDTTYLESPLPDPRLCSVLPEFFPSNFATLVSSMNITNASPSCPNLVSGWVQWIYATFLHMKDWTWSGVVVCGSVGEDSTPFLVPLSAKLFLGTREISKVVRLLFFRWEGTTPHSMLDLVPNQDWTHVPLLQEAGILTTRPWEKLWLGLWLSCVFDHDP